MKTIALLLALALGACSTASLSDLAASCAGQGAVIREGAAVKAKMTPAEVAAVDREIMATNKYCDKAAPPADLKAANEAVLASTARIGINVGLAKGR